MVTEVRPMVLWNKRASIYFRNIFDRIKRDSYSNAEKVRDGIIKIIDTLPENPEKYPPDKFKRNNTGLFRAFEKFSYRISYRFTTSEIRILRIRHVKQEPKEF